MIGTATQGLWERCARALGREDWIDDPRFLRNADRMRHRAALEAELQGLLASWSTSDCVAALDAAGVPCGPVNTYAQLFADPQVRHLGVVVHVQDSELGGVPHVRTPIVLSETRLGVRTVAPKLGQHTAEVLGALGYDAKAIDELRGQGVV